MQMSKEEFVAYIQRMARREREQKELAAMEHERRLKYEMNDYILTVARKAKWTRRYRRRPKRLSDDWH